MTEAESGETWSGKSVPGKHSRERARHEAPSHLLKLDGEAPSGSVKLPTHFMQFCSQIFCAALSGELGASGGR
jgi:hypothetical protein